MVPEIHPQWNLKEVEDLREGPALRLLLADPLQRESVTVPRVFAEPTQAGPARIGWDATQNQRITKGLRGSECLLSFIQLHAKADKDIVRFAKRWGPLGICAHGKPATHHPECMPLSAPDRVWEPEDQSFRWTLSDLDVTKVRNGRPWRRFWEPLSSWRFYSRQFSALLWVANTLAAGETPSPRQWFAAFPWQEAIEYDALVVGKPYPSYARHSEWTELNVQHLIEEDARDGWGVLAGFLNRLVVDTRLVTVMTAPPGEARLQPTLAFGRTPATNPWADEFRPDADSLFALLTAQLAAMLENPSRIYRCSLCGEIVNKDRKPKAGQRILCDSRTCHEKAERETKRNWAAKRREKARAERAVAGDTRPAPAVQQ